MEQNQITVKNYQEKCKELTTIVYELTEQRYEAVPRRNSSVAKALAEAVLSLQAAMRTFESIYKLSD